MEEFHLLEQIAVALGLGFAGGLAARLAGLSPIVGYLGAGMIISPFTPGYVGDISTLQELADLGIIFLMFGVGLHFNFSDLLAVRKIAIPGAIAQMTIITLVSIIAGFGFGLGVRESLILGLALSISSTVIVVRTLEDKGMLASVHGRVSIGWLIVQDFATVLFLAVLPALPSGSWSVFAREAAIDLVTAIIFLTIILVAGARLMPKLLELVAKAGSRELFILAVVSVALGVAAGAAFFGLSVALGAFAGGVVVSERETSHQAAADVLPLREAFAVLFFVAVGMIVDPGIVIDNFWLVVVVTFIVIVVKGLTTVFIAATFPYSVHTALITGAGLAQIGEFSFIIAKEGMDAGLVAESTYNVVLAAAVISIVLNPLTFRGIPLWERYLKKNGPVWRWADRQGPPPEEPPQLSSHVIIAGYGRVGQLTGHSLNQLGMSFIVIDTDLDLVRKLNQARIPAIWGDAASSDVLILANIQRARLMAVCVPDASSSMLLVAAGRKLNPGMPIIVRARDSDEIPILKELGANEIVVPEYEGGLELMRLALTTLGFDPEEALHYSLAVRDIHYLQAT